MNILDFIYNMSVWQWIGVFWVQLVFNYLIIKMAKIVMYGIYEIILVRKSMDQLNTLTIDELKLLRDNMDSEDD